jgi:hypothetical protein
MSIDGSKLAKAIQHAIDEAKLAYAFRAGTYTMSALNAVLAVEAIYLREADRMAQYLDHRPDTTSNHPTTNRTRAL